MAMAAAFTSVGAQSTLRHATFHSFIHSTSRLCEIYVPVFEQGLSRGLLFNRNGIILHLCNERRENFIGWKGKDNVRPLHVTQAIKLVETYDGSFELDPESEKTLRALLSSEVFCKQVAEQAGEGGVSTFEFTGELFKPVPWSVTTKHGMPQEFEKYLDRKKYVIINVPPNFVFKAKIFSPSRLCAVFKKVSNLPVTDS